MERVTFQHQKMLKKNSLNGEDGKYQIQDDLRKNLRRSSSLSDRKQEGALRRLSIDLSKFTDSTLDKDPIRTKSMTTRVEVDTSNNRTESFSYIGIYIYMYIPVILCSRKIK